MATITIFASSLSIASILVLAKALELKFGKKNIFLALISRLDNVANNLIDIFKFRSLQLIQSVRYIILVQSHILLSEFLDRIKDRIRNEYQVRQEIMMGRKVISNKGSVSFYLKKISESKGNVGRGKIEDSLEV